MEETIEMLKFLNFPRSFGKQCFAVVDAPYSKLAGISYMLNNVRIFW